jgi:hypothetical protein
MTYINSCLAASVADGQRLEFIKEILGVGVCIAFLLGLYFANDLSIRVGCAVLHSLLLLSVAWSCRLGLAWRETKRYLTSKTLTSFNSFNKIYTLKH